MKKVISFEKSEAMYYTNWFFFFYHMTSLFSSG